MAKDCAGFIRGLNGKDRKCPKRASFVRGGHFFCREHDPVTLAAKQAELAEQRAKKQTAEEFQRRLVDFQNEAFRFVHRAASVKSLTKDQIVGEAIRIRNLDPRSPTTIKKQ